MAIVYVCHYNFVFFLHIFFFFFFYAFNSFVRSTTRTTTRKKNQRQTRKAFHFKRNIESKRTKKKAARFNNFLKEISQICYRIMLYVCHQWTINLENLFTFLSTAFFSSIGNDFLLILFFFFCFFFTVQIVEQDKHYELFDK